MEGDMINLTGCRCMVKWGFYLCCIFLPVIAMAQDASNPGMKVVFLYNEAKDEIKPRCLEIMGRHSFKPEYECYDGKNGELKPFYTGRNWIPLAVTPVCLKSQLKGTIKPYCIAYQVKADKKYVCFDQDKKKYISFDPKTEWAELNSDHPDCKTREFGPDVIKDVEFDIVIPQDTGTDKPDQKKEDKK
jgi:hypothetical protein